ncbi:hypothetical protein [Lysinibacillus pakistanensis]|uniref:Uncharacterized protein n=1 Tax=Lysinibacillus pakistanensis TaxID=759811 RepID=A0AAX3WRY5_9BACI|nr:hypothetical protein [Lysinibacillus pakistanensis]MDM5233651.1 hypothetical protein [Lysinibacillus pakistanensis]WHY44278.1 hypothetical protein QNH22_13090 [Lysinibacillus pakistanensis]WHY49285.1 hypothetical protein QNH24_13070 [Lysinibacillus pakistanensis]
MNLQYLYNEYLNIKFNRDLPASHFDYFEYDVLEDGSAQLFFVDQKNEAFLEWAEELQPRDPYYINNPSWKPVLSSFYKQLNIYDEQTFYYLLFTINSTTAIHSINPYNAMNDFMKNYCFFQLAQLSAITRLNDEQKRQLKDFFFFFYLYAHPVNEETLYAFSFNGQDLVHTKSNIQIEHYFNNYHDYYSENSEKFHHQLLITPHEVIACKNLTLELLRAIEGKSSKLIMPPEEGMETVLRLINDVDYFLQTYTDNKATVYDVMKNVLADHCSNPYQNYCFHTLLQNYVTYVLYFQFDEINNLVDYFRDSPLWCKLIINKIFADTIFLQKIMRQGHIDINEYPHIIKLFEKETRRIYL